MAEIRFRVKSGKHYARDKDGRSGCYRKGEVFSADPERMKAFMDKLEQVDPDPPEPQPTAELQLVKREDGKYDVVHPDSGDKLNDEPLSRYKAQQLIGQEQGNDNSQAEAN